MKNKVTIIGSGSVGATIAYTMTVTGIASEIVMIDINVEKSLGEALDIKQGLPFCPPVSIYAGSYADAKDSDIVIITSGVARKPGQSRLDLAQTNVNIMKSVIPAITKEAPDAIYIVVANPVDILTYQFYKTSGLPAAHILGSGTILDTARLRSRIADYYKINQKNVHAFVFGEHGDSSFVPWSLANISNIPIDSYESCLAPKDAVSLPLVHEEVEDYIRKSGAKIIARKGATFYAVAISVCHICRCILSSTESTLTVSTMMQGEYGISDVCLSTLTVIGNNGVKSHVVAPLQPDEITKLQHSAQCLRHTISDISF
ncbi:MAG: L-lactate dehydrogenase [Spirochaetia bacterium]|jgi:L-lactate dehydrogenase|nr:L-lactate dehydrogenase [Spirochaetia bacterium]